MRVIFLHPRWNRSCQDCIRWMHDESGARTVRRKEITTASGVRKRIEVPVPMPIGMELPCVQCAKIPEGASPCPQNAVELSSRNQQALAHYMQCRAVGAFPEDPIVYRNAEIIRRVTDLLDRIALRNVLARLGVDSP